MEGHVPTCLNKLFTHFIDTTENVREVREQCQIQGVWVGWNIQTSLDCAGIATQVLERSLQFVFLHIKQDSKGAI